MNTLLERAKDMEAWAEKHFIDSNGVVYTMIDCATEAPLTDNFFEPEAESFPMPGCTPAEFWNYENCGMTTGAYLQAMVCRYEATRDSGAMAQARRSYQALRHVYEMGKQLEEGFFPKIYGGRFSTQTSTDQVLYAVLALDRYAAQATDDERRDIANMIGNMIRFWSKRDFKYNYYNVVNMQWKLARFPSLLLLAYRHTNDSVFRTECDRLLAQGVNRYPGEEQLRPKRAGERPLSDYEQQQGAWMISNMADCATMDVMELDYLLRSDPDSEWVPTWRQSMRQMWEEGALTIAPDGKVYVNVLVDMKTGKPRPPDPILFDWLDAYGWSYVRYVSGAKSGWSSMIARAGVQAAPHVPDPKPVVAEARRILTALDIKDLTYLEQPERLLPRHRFMTRFYSGDAMTNWLWSYWQGKISGFWE